MHPLFGTALSLQSKAGKGEEGGKDLAQIFFEELYFSLRGQLSSYNGLAVRILAFQARGLGSTPSCSII